MTRSGHHASIGAAKEGELGTILVDSKGRTLYLFRRDPGPESTCLGACASAWPPLRATGKPTVSGGADGSLVGTSPRSDGRQQVTYNGHPLYLYAGDEKAGDTRGEGLTDFGASWYALTPSGQQVSGQASRSYGSSKASVPLAYVVPALAPRARAFIHRANGGLPARASSSVTGPTGRAVGPTLPHQQAANSNQIGLSR